MNVGIVPHIITDGYSCGQILTLFKTIVLVFIVITGKAPALVTMGIWKNDAPSLGWVVLSGKTRVKDPHLNFRHAFLGSSDSSNDARISRYSSHMACWHSFSMQLRCSKSYSPILDGKTWIMSSMMSRTLCEHLRLLDRSDLESRPRCTSWLIYHTLRT